MSSILKSMLSIHFFLYFWGTMNDVFRHVISVQLFLGIVICMMSLHMYFAPPSMLVDLPSTTKAAPESLKEISIDRKNES